MSFDNIVKVTMYLQDLADIPASRPARVDGLGDRRLASTVLFAKLANPAWKIEIEVIACT